MLWVKFSPSNRFSFSGLIACTAALQAQQADAASTSHLLELSRDILFFAARRQDFEKHKRIRVGINNLGQKAPWVKNRPQKPHYCPIMATPAVAPAFDVLSTTASQLQSLLISGKITSVQIVETYLEQIEKHNHSGARLHAIIATAERGVVLAKAAALDGERRNGKLRGPLHGIPIIVKDCFTFEPGIGLGTTVGSHAFAQERGIRNAGVIQQVS